jgi:hypothetical protein
MVRSFKTYLETFVPKRVDDRNNDEHIPFEYKRFKYIISSHTVYPDNDHGDYDENDIVEEDVDTLEDILHIVRRYGIDGQYWESQSPDTNFVNGHQTFYHFHIKHEDGSELSPDEKATVSKMIKGK